MNVFERDALALTQAIKARKISATEILGAHANGTPAASPR